MKNAIVVALVAAVALFVAYQNDPSLFGLLPYSDGFQDLSSSNDKQTPGSHASSGPKDAQMNKQKQGFQNQDKKEEKKDEKKQGFQDMKDEMKQGFQDMKEKKEEGFADLEAFQGPANFGAAESPAGCYPRDQLTPSELLPKDMNSVWAEQNPMGPGSLKGKNFLSAGALIGVNTVGQSLRNANLQLRSEPANPQLQVSIFNQSTISPDISHRPLEIGA